MGSNPTLDRRTNTSVATLGRRAAGATWARGTEPRWTTPPDSRANLQQQPRVDATSTHTAWPYLNEDHLEDGHAGNAQELASHTTGRQVSNSTYPTTTPTSTEARSMGSRNRLRTDTERRNHLGSQEHHHLQQPRRTQGDRRATGTSEATFTRKDASR